MISPETFLEALAESRLLSSKRLGEIREAMEKPKGPKAAPQLADWLVERKWVTRWQAKMLLSNRRAFHLGKYKLLSMIGQGGMGAVFQAEQQPLGRIVALKVMAEKLVKDKTSVARFHREIQAAASLSHPNIVAAYDADSVGSTHFLVMEYVAGKTLEDLVRKNGPLPIKDACEYIRQAALGLQHAFERGMIHRDIKPSNLLVTKVTGEDGEVPVLKILDMGLARVVSETADDGSLTQTGQVLGTPDYIAPEQARNTRTADIRSDIFSLGCTLFRMLTGGLPYGGTTLMEKLMARGMNEAQRARAVRPEVPQALDNVLAKMLARNPAERYQTPAEVAAALSPFSRGIAVPETAAAVQAGSIVNAEPAATPSPRPPDSSLQDFLQQLASSQPTDTPLATTEVDTAQTPVAAAGVLPVDSTTVRLSRRAAAAPSRKAMLIVGGAAAGVIATVVLALWIWSAWGTTVLTVEWPEDQREGGVLQLNGQKLPVPEKGAIEISGKAGAQSLKVTRKGYVPIEEKWSFGRGERKTVTLNWKPTENTRRSLALQAIRTEVEGTRGNLSRGILKDNDRSVALSWDHTLVYIRGNAGTPQAVKAVELLASLPAVPDGLKRIRVPDHLMNTINSAGKPALQPREVVAVFGDNRVRGIDETRAVAFSPDGKWIATSGEDSLVRLWNASDLKLARTLFAHNRPSTQLEFSSDSQRLYQGCAEYVDRFDVRTGNLQQSWRMSGKRSGAVTRFALSRDEKRVAAGNDYGGLAVWNTDSKAPLHTLEYYGDDIYSLAFSPDAATLFAVGNGVDDGTKRRRKGEAALSVWDVETGTLKKSVEDLPGWTGALSPDGRFLAVRGEGRLNVWDTSTGEVVQRLQAPGDPRSITFSSDGSRLGIVRDDVRLWDTSTWKELAAVDVTGSRIQFLPDGKAVAVLSEEHRVQVRSLESAVELYKTNPSIRSAAVSGDGRSLWAGLSDGRIQEISLADGAVRRTLGPFWGPVEQLAVRPDGKQLVAATSGTSRKNQQGLQMIDLESGQALAIPWRTGMPMCLRYSPDGARWAMGTFEGYLEARESVTGTELFSVLTRPSKNRYEVFGIDWSPDGSTLALGAWDQEASLQWWSVDGKRKLAGVSGNQGHVLGVAFSPDGKTLYSSGNDGTIRSWDVDKHESKVTVVYHGKPIRSLAVSPDGTQILGASSDGTVVVADLPDGEHHGKIEFPSGVPLRSVQWTPEGRHAIAVSADGTAFVLRLGQRKK